MAWTLVVALCIVTYVLVALFSKTFRIFQRKAFVYPSEAEIDQILPPEIIEAILYNVDMKTLRSCSLVSKYWRYHAEKDFIFANALESEQAPRATLAELAEDLITNQPEIKWLTYPETYNPAWHAQDGHYVKNAGKKLLDIQYASLLKISKSMKRPTWRDSFDDPAKKYVVRTRMRFSFATSGGNTMYFYTGNEFATVDAQSLPDHVRANLGKGMNIEILEGLDHLRNSTTIRLTNPARIVDSRTFIGGIPIDSTIFSMMYLLFLPCVIKDFWNTSTETKEYFIKLCAGIGLLGATIASTLACYDGVHHNQTVTKAKARACFGFGILGFVLLVAIFFSYAMEVGLQCTMEVGLVFYGVIILMMRDYRHPNLNHMLFLAFCLAVSIIDWKLTVEAFKSGAIWYTLLYNLAIHVILWAWTVFIALSNNALSTGHIKLIGSDVKHLSKFFAWAMLCTLYVTCAAPYSMRKVNF